MAIDDLAAALRKEAEEECRALVEEARRQALGIGDLSAKERDVVVERETRELARSLVAEGMTLVYRAGLEVDGERERIVAGFVEAARAGALARLDALRGEAVYAGLFGGLVTRATAGMSAGATLRIDPRDEALARALPHRNPPLTVVPDLTTKGGVVAESPDGRITADATVEGCLARFCRDAAPGIVRLLEEEPG